VTIKSWRDHPWFDQNLKYMYEQPDDLSQFIFALYLLLVEFDYGGMRHYLDTHSADELPQVRRCFGQFSFTEGVVWLARLEELYGEPIHADMESRFNHMVASYETTGNDNPFEQADAELLPLVPEIEAILEKLVIEKQAEVASMGWVNRRHA
jgi:hypothetical protein